MEAPRAIENWSTRYRYYTQLLETRTKIFEKAKKLGEAEGLWLSQKYDEHLKKLNEKFGDDVLAYAAGHAFCGSTVPEDPNEDYEENSNENWSTYIHHTDFPGDFSIKKHYNDLEAELDLMAKNK